MEDSRIRQRIVAALRRLAGPGRLHTFKGLTSAMEMTRALEHDVSILGRGIQLGMNLTTEWFGLALELACPRDLHMFLHQGKHWLVVYNGVPKQVSDSTGMAYIALLLQAPGKEVHANALRASVSGRCANVILGSPQELLDQGAIDDYKARLAEVEKSLTSGAVDYDSEEGRALLAEQAWYKNELRRGADRHGRPKEVSFDAEKARKSVSIAIRRALETIRRTHKPLWLHLHDSIDMGEFLIYRGDPSPPWIT